MDYQIIRYTPEWRALWDEFVASSRNATFLFLRDYMDYHADRFIDASWIALKKGKPIALFPANVIESTLYSHQGLTYGGWLLPPAHLDGADLLDIFTLATFIWQEAGYREVIYKSIPYIYHRSPSQEEDYALFRLGAQLIRTDLSMAIDLRNPIAFNKLRRRALAKTSQLPIRIREISAVGADNPKAALQPFHNLLAQCLSDRHGATPVHTLSELTSLHLRFPSNIRFFIVETELSECEDPRGLETASTNDNEDPRGLETASPDAAVCIFDTGLVAHAQYICTSQRGRELDLLTPLFHHLITETFADRRYFDFGTSNEDNGRRLNAGLLRQKASFGASGVAHNTFCLPL